MEAAVKKIYAETLEQQQIEVRQGVLDENRHTQVMLIPLCQNPVINLYLELHKFERNGNRV